MNQNSTDDQLQNQNKSKCSEIAANECLTRGEIKGALKKIYVAESEPVEVGSIKARTGLALMLIIIGTGMITAMLGYKYLAFEASMIVPSIIFLTLAFLIGFAISTLNIRKIYHSMSRFNDMKTPAYRRVFSNSKWQSQAVVYSTLACLILLGAQSLGFLVIQNPQNNIEDDPDNKIITEGIIDIELVNTDGPFIDNGQSYIRASVIINNSLDYYSEDLILMVKSYFAGNLYHKVNNTISDPDKLTMNIRINIHDEDDTKLSFYIMHREKSYDRQISAWHISSQKDIYIVEAYAITHKKPFSISKSVEINVKVYNDGEAREATTVSLVFTSPNLKLLYEKVTNNETLAHGDTWEPTFKLDNVIDDDIVFKVNLKIKGESESKDETQVLAS